MIITSVYDESTYLRVSMGMYVGSTLGLCNRIEKWSEMDIMILLLKKLPGNLRLAFKWLE